GDRAGGEPPRAHQPGRHDVAEPEQAHAPQRLPDRRRARSPGGHLVGRPSRRAPVHGATRAARSRRRRRIAMSSRPGGAFRRVRGWFGRLGTGLLEFVLGNTLLVGFFLLAAILITLFFVGLARLAPSSPGQERPISNAMYLIRNGNVAGARLLDEDNRVELLTNRGLQVWATYPDQSFTTDLIATLQKA